VSREVGVGYWSLKFGRKDGRQSSKAAADKYVPMGRESVTDLIAFFESNGLNVRDLVVLSGAHTIGKATCAAVKPRICKSKPETLDGKYGDFLRRKCRHSGDFAEYERVELDGETPTAFDNVYYKNLERKMGLLETDQKLLEDSRTRSFVEEMVREPEEFKHEFAMAMRRLGEVQVLTGDEGEVRHKCSAVNKY
jgi:peroxidase